MTDYVGKPVPTSPKKGDTWTSGVKGQLTFTWTGDDWKITDFGIKKKKSDEAYKRAMGVI